MTAADIWYEYRQILALEYEMKTGKPYRDRETIQDDSYEAFQRSLGVDVDA